MNSLGRAIVIFVFMALLTVHAATGLLAAFTEKKPRAVEAIDALIQTGLASWLGHANALALLAFLTILLPFLAYRRPVADARQSEPQSTAISRARLQRAVERKPPAGLKPEDRQLLAAFIDGATMQLKHEQAMIKANEQPKPFVRLVPRVPISEDRTMRSWFGGHPSLPTGTAWPTCDEKPAAFLAQVDCSALPAELWGSIGPRTGWLSFFLGYEDGYLAARVLHTQNYGTPLRPPAPIKFDWHYLGEGIPRWPVDVLPVSLPEEDPGAALKPKNDDGNPRRALHRSGIDLNGPGFRPFDWDSALLMLDTAEAYGKQALRRSQWEQDAALRGSAWQACLNELEVLQKDTAELSASEAFSETRLNALIAALAAMAVPGQRGTELMPAFPSVCPPHASDCWLTDWMAHALQRATHLYAEKPGVLPPAWYAKAEEQAAFDAGREMGTMRDVPEGYVHDFTIGHDVTLLQLRTSHLMNWIWGDTYDLVFTINKADLARSEFGHTRVQITN